MSYESLAGFARRDYGSPNTLPYRLAKPFLTLEVPRAAWLCQAAHKRTR